MIDMHPVPKAFLLHLTKVRGSLSTQKIDRQSVFKLVDAVDQLLMASFPMVAQRHLKKPLVLPVESADSSGTSEPSQTASPQEA